MVEKLNDANGIERDITAKIGRRTATGTGAIDGAAQGIRDGTACQSYSLDMAVLSIRLAQHCSTGLERGEARWQMRTRPRRV